MNKRPEDVAGMFDGVARRYDRTNTVLSGGNDILWRAAMVRAVAPVAGERILDVAAGTGTSSAALARSGARVVAVDFSPGMVAEGRRKHKKIEFIEADGNRERAKLSWISPITSKYLFVNRRGLKVCDKSGIIFNKGAPGFNLITHQH